MIEGQGSDKIEVLRHEDYKECKKLQFDEEFAFIVNECRNKGYQASLTINEDSRTKEFYAELELTWNS